MEQSLFNFKSDKSYNGHLMQKGKAAEEIVLEWLKKHSKSVIDFREWRLTQKLDVDCGIESIDGSICLAEIKSDRNLGATGNFLFEIFRINHFINPDKVFYLGWTFRSPAKYLLYYSPNENAIYRFEFQNIRQKIGLYLSECDSGCCPRSYWEFTDKQKTTFNILIPQKHFEGNFKKYFINASEWEDRNVSKV